MWGMNRIKATGEFITSLMASCNTYAQPAHCIWHYCTRSVIHSVLCMLQVCCTYAD
jgi:hypothetical protein